MNVEFGILIRTFILEQFQYLKKFSVFVFNVSDSCLKYNAKIFNIYNNCFSIRSWKEISSINKIDSCIINCTITKRRFLGNTPLYIAWKGLKKKKATFSLYIVKNASKIITLT